MKTTRHIFFTILVFLLFLLGLATGSFYYAVWTVTPVQEWLVEKIGDLYGERFWLYAIFILAFEILLFLITYIISLDRTREGRPYIRLYLSAFALIYPAIALYISPYEEILDQPLTITIVAIITIASPLLLFLFEWLALRSLNFLSRITYFARLWTLSQYFSRLALCFSSRNPEAQLYYGLNLYQKGEMEKARDVLHWLYESEKQPTLELYETMLDISEKTRDTTLQVDVLEKLHALVPEKTEWRNRLITALEQAGHLERAATLLEEEQRFTDLNYVVRLERMYAQFNPEKAKTICSIMSELEGYPYSQTLIAYRTLLQKIPDDIVLLEAAADLNIKTNHLEEACDYLEQILYHLPARKDIRERLIDIYRRQHNYKQLQRHLTILFQENPDISSDLTAEYIDSLIHTEASNTAIPALKQVQERFPLDYRFPTMLAEIYYENKDYEHAIEEMAKALALAPEDKKGKLTVLKHKIQGAMLNRELEEIRKQIEERPNDVELRFKYIENLTANAYVEKAAAELDQLLYYRPDLEQQAREHLTRLCERYERTFVLLNYLSDLYLRDNNYDKALDILKIMSSQSLHPDDVLTAGCNKILKIKNDYEPAWRCLAEVEYKNRHWEQAETAYEHCLAFNPPDSGKLYVRLFEIYWNQNKFEKVTSVAALAIQTEPYDITLYKRLARAHMRLEQHREALKWLMEAKNIDTSDREVFELIKQADQRVKEERLLELKDLVQKYPENTHYHYEIAELFLHFNHLNEAVLHFQRAAQQPMLATISKAKLALCLVKKGMYDIAEETLEEISLSMKNEEESNQVKSIIYDIAAEYEQEKILDKALKYYKEVFRVDAGFRNVVGKIERLQSSPFLRKT